MRTEEKTLGKNGWDEQNILKGDAVGEKVATGWVATTCEWFMVGIPRYGFLYMVMCHVVIVAV